VTVDVRAAKRRLAVMGGINAVSLLAAAGALYGYFGMGVAWALPVFLTFLAVGIGAQIWFIAAVRRANKGA
jgi:hypothetical protein